MQFISPFPEEHLPLMWKWIEEFREQMLDDNSPQSYEAMVEHSRSSLERGAKQYACLMDGVPAGMIWGEFAGDGMYIGHLVFDREVLSSSEKLEASREALKLMFATGARKVIWQMFADNRAFRIFLKRLGAEIEGTLKQGTRRKGQLVDITLMASFPENTK